MKRMNAAEENYNADAQLRSLIEEYKAQDNAKAANDDPSFNEAIEKRMGEIYTAITVNPIYIEYTAAQEDVHRLMHSVNDEINFMVTGEHACSGSCEGCEGGCH